ncbi:MAG: Unknown protein [uncultured Thiotrichaceae bacterium]|uniref:Uncharacterized protein n=1 Tax=uncultured Thiotrichaceae bacterium TaxID=298394 RepID=A0A6S6TL75_9GAMM|nr:MAG: Unknown protein [uncultured Thiotrichaceae bacterium]
MLKYLLGILLVQIVTVVLVLLAPSDLQGLGVLRLIIPLLFVSFITAFWFSSLAQHLRKDELARVKDKFAREREDLRVKAERAKTRVVKQAQQDIAKEARSTHAKANFKVGATFAGAVGFGSLLLLTQFLTIGVVLLATSGGALGGYLYRGKKLKNALVSSQDQPRIIEQKPAEESRPKQLKQ